MYNAEMLPPISEIQEKKLPCIVVYDTSASLRGFEQAIREGLQALKDAIGDDDMARAKVDLALIEFNSHAEVKQNFTLAANMEVPAVNCNGATATHEAIQLAIEMVEARKQQYKDAHVAYDQPWIWLITDGQSNDRDNGSFRKLLEMQKNKKCVFYGVAMGPEAVPGELTAMHKNNICFRTSKDGFREVFEYISQSMSNASSPNPVYATEMETPDEDSGIEVLRGKKMISL